MAEDLSSQKSRNRGITAEISGPDSGPPLAPRSSPTFWPGETGLEHLGKLPSRGSRCFGCPSCVRPPTGSSSLLRQYRQVTPRCHVPCCKPLTRKRGGSSTRSLLASWNELEWHPLRTNSRVPYPRAIPSISSCCPPARRAMWIGDRRGGSQVLHCISTCSSHRGQPQQTSLATARLITHQSRPVGPPSTAARHVWHCWALCPPMFEMLVGVLRRDPHCRSVKLHPCHVVAQWSALSRGMSVSHWTPAEVIVMPGLLPCLDQLSSLPRIARVQRKPAGGQSWGFSWRCFVENARSNLMPQ